MYPSNDTAAADTAAAAAAAGYYHASSAAAAYIRNTPSLPRLHGYYPHTQHHVSAAHHHHAARMMYPTAQNHPQQQQQQLYNHNHTAVVYNGMMLMQPQYVYRGAHASNGHVNHQPPVQQIQSKMQMEEGLTHAQTAVDSNDQGDSNLNLTKNGVAATTGSDTLAVSSSATLENAVDLNESKSHVEVQQEEYQEPKHEEDVLNNVNNKDNDVANKKTAPTRR